MRLSHFTIAIALITASATSLLLACGGSSSNDVGTTDSGAATQDATTVESFDAGAIDSASPVTTDATSSTATDAGACAAPSAAGFVTAAHGPLPDMVYGGGGILTAPRMVTFTFSDTFEPAQLAAFGQTITQTQWFAEVTKDYCVPNGGTCIQGGTTGEAIALDAGSATTWVNNSFNPPGSGLSDAGTDFTGFLLTQVAAVSDGGLAGADPNAIYTFYFSPNATFYMGDPNLGGQPGCGFGGYHSAVGSLPNGGGTPITYAIIVNCAAGAPAADELEGLTVAASHELVEATTDPYDGTGWYLDQDQNYLDAGLPTPANLRNQAWADTDQFGEIGDNCESLINSTWTLDGGDVVQRIWSASAAAAGQNPCIPVPAGETYFNATPDKAIYVAEIGSSFTIDVTGFSTTPRAGWAVQAVDQTANQLPDGGTNAPLLAMEFVGGVDAGNVAPGGSEIPCINNGTQAELKVTLLGDPAADPALNNPFVQPIWQQAEGVIVSLDTSASPFGGGGSAVYYPYQLWPFAVVTPQIAATIGLTSSGLNETRRPTQAADRLPSLRHPRTWQRPHTRR